MKGASTLLAALVLAATACTPRADDTTADAAAPAAAVAAGAQDKDQGMTALKPPSADSVLYFIYQRDGDGARSYEIDGGRIVSYWLGHAFDFKGRHYFTGFANSTAGDGGEEADDGLMAPGRVAISQATLVQVDDGGQPAWSRPDTDGYVGEFGTNDHADAVDATREVQSHETADGRLLLAVPTKQFESGVAITSYALFVFDPDNVDQLKHRSWGYLGTIVAGTDNAAACDGGAVMPCAASTGTLTFEDAGGKAGLPTLKIVPAGQASAGPGEVRTLGPADALTYDFDANAGSYAP